MIGAQVHWLDEHEVTKAAYDMIINYPQRGDIVSHLASHMHSNTSVAIDASITQKETFHSISDRLGEYRPTEYVEVKSTRFNDRNVFEISPWEWKFCSTDSRVPYHIFRVFNAGSAERVHMVIIRNVYQRVVEGRCKLCLAI